MTFENVGYASRHSNLSVTQWRAALLA